MGGMMACWRLLLAALLSCSIPLNAQCPEGIDPPPYPATTYGHACVRFTVVHHHTKGLHITVCHGYLDFTATQVRFVAVDSNHSFSVPRASLKKGTLWQGWLVLKGQKFLNVEPKAITDLAPEKTIGKQYET